MPDDSASDVIAKLLERAQLLAIDLEAFAPSAQHEAGVAVSSSLRALRRQIDHTLAILGETESPMTLDEAKHEIDVAMISVDPNLAKQSQWARASARVEQRGSVFDVRIHYAGELFLRFEHAIRERLGRTVDVITRHQ